MVLSPYGEYGWMKSTWSAVWSVCVGLCLCVCWPSIDLQSPHLSVEHEKTRQDRQEKDKWGTEIVRRMRNTDIKTEGERERVHLHSRDKMTIHSERHYIDVFIEKERKQKQFQLSKVEHPPSAPAVQLLCDFVNFSVRHTAKILFPQSCRKCVYLPASIFSCMPVNVRVCPCIHT